MSTHAYLGLYTVVVSFNLTVNERQNELCRFVYHRVGRGVLSFDNYAERLAHDVIA